MIAVDECEELNVNCPEGENPMVSLQSGTATEKGLDTAVMV